MQFCVFVCACVCHTGSVVLRAENRLREFENRVLGKTVGYMWETVTGD
jgi:ABC-type protease/lipase transport system fused ATPase/permease subunit